MSVTVGNILDLLEGIAPLSLAEEWDNSGLLIGNRDREVSCVLCALDLNSRVLEEAIACGAQMIVAHHPVLFRARRNLVEDDAEGRLLCDLIRANIAFAAMHTNFDNAYPGVNDALAKELEMTNITCLENGMRMGCLSECTLADFAKHVERKLGGSVRVYGDANKRVSSAAVLGGAGGDYAQQAIDARADVFVTGEIGYHKALSAIDEGMCVIEAGHAATEKPAISFLVSALQNAVNDVEYNVRVLCSSQELFL